MQAAPGLPRRFAPRNDIPSPSPPGLTRWSMLTRRMDCRIKSGNDAFLLLSRKPLIERNDF
jgi:hypothetical protein